MFKNLISKIEKKFITWYDAYRAKRIAKLRDAKWAELETAALKPWVESGDKSALAIADILVKNQIRALRERSVHSAPRTGTDVIVDPIDVAMFNISVQVIKGIIGLRSIVAVQPMTGPVGLAYLMTYKEAPESSIDAHRDGFKQRRIRLEIISRAMQACTRKLQAGWTVDAVQDLKTMHGLDLENELTNIIAQAIEEEIVLEILNDLKHLAADGGNVSTFELFEDAPDSVPVGTKLMLRIFQAANEIASKTRRGAGNFIIASPITISLLQSAAKSVFEAAPKSEVSKYGCLTYVGTLNGSMKVYCSHVIDDKIIIGYKGGNGETDTGYFYGPYVPVMSAGIVINPTTFQPAVSIMTRFSKLTGKANEATGELFDSSSYYQVIELAPLATTLPTVEADSQDQSLTSVLPPPSDELYERVTGGQGDAKADPELVAAYQLNPQIVAAYQEDVEVKTES